MIRKGIIVTRDGMRLLGGPGSGNFGHGGIPGQRGGSAPGGGSGGVDTDIKGTRQRNKDFEGEDFKGKDISQVTANNCTFSNAEMSGVKTGPGQYTGCKFISTDLKNSDLSNTIFKDSDFSNADLRGTSFKDAQIYNCDFDGAEFDEGTDFSGALVQGMNGEFYSNGMKTDFASGSYYTKNPDEE